MAWAAENPASAAPSPAASVAAIHHPPIESIGRPSEYTPSKAGISRPDLDQL